jgi:hypothetical protein
MSARMSSWISSRKSSRRRRPARRAADHEGEVMAKRVLMAQAALIAGAAMGALVKEFPNILREIRIWRMAGRRTTGRHA